MRNGHLPAARVLLRVIAVGAAGVIATHCGDRHSPTSPASMLTTSKGAPIIRSITLDRQNVEAGQNVTATAQVDDPDTPLTNLRYEWSVSPSSGALDGNGKTGRWQSPGNDQVPGSYTLTVTIVKSYIGLDGSGRPTNLEYRVTATSAPITVNDAQREMKANSEAFLADFMNPNVSPAMCVRNFADSCDGRQDAMQDAATARDGYSDATVAYRFGLFQLGNQPSACSSPDGSARCALTVYQVEWVRTRKSDGVQERVTGTEYLTGIYDKNRWWLCTSRFSPQ